MAQNSVIDKKNIFEPILSEEARDESTEVDEFLNDVVSWALDGSNENSSNTKDSEGEFELSYFFTPGNSALEQGIYPIRISVVSIPVSGIYVHTKEPEYILCYTLSGSGTVYLLGKEYEFKKGGGIFIDCQQYHEYIANAHTGWRCVFICISGNIIPDLYQLLNKTNNLHFTMQSYSRFNQLLRKMLKSVQTIYSDQQLFYSSCLLALLTELISFHNKKEHPPRKIPPIIHDIRNFLQTSYNEPITLDSLAKQFHLSKFHLSREFKKYTELSPNEFLIRIRIEKAKELLVSTELSIAEVARSVGVMNTNHFLYLFHKYENMAPSVFRKYWAQHFDIISLKK